MAEQVALQKTDPKGRKWHTWEGRKVHGIIPGTGYIAAFGRQRDEIWTEPVIAFVMEDIVEILHEDVPTGDPNGPKFRIREGHPIPFSREPNLSAYCWTDCSAERVDFMDDFLGVFPTGTTVEEIAKIKEIA